MNLCLEREGEFDPINMRESDNRCGPHWQTRYKYSVRIDATDENLSPEGFVIENGRIHNYFLTRYCSGRSWIAISCERMAMRAAMEMGRTLVGEGISVISVRVTIKGSGDARLTAVWRRDRDKQLAAKVKAKSKNQY